jgi:hypothetical protein
VSLVVLTPSRGRPERAKECYQAFLDTRSLPDTEMWFVLDEGDPSTDAYEVPLFHVKQGRRGMTDALNQAAERYWDSAEVLGFIGDDHRFRTPGWDEIFVNHLREIDGGFAYGNDQIWLKGEIPTQIFGSAKIWKALGWMALPPCQHLYLDNTWLFVGDALNRLLFFPEVIVEHEHPTVGKAQWDAQYKELNATSMYNHDSLAFAEWLANDADAALERVRAVL